jgi:transcriptional regulator with XRE-family HTH domain
MNRSTYGERDYAFGQAMLTLRTGIGLTQAGLADLLHVSRRAVAEWEAGSNYPTVGHLKHLIALGVRQQAFAAGREVEEIRALWKAARQKVNLDELWLAALLGELTTPLAPLPFEQTGGSDRVISPPITSDKGGSGVRIYPARTSRSGFQVPPTGGPRLDWGDALAVPAFYGREEELALLTGWVVQDLQV